MLSILLTILKIIGIILLVLLGLIVLLICLVLFVPIRYRAEGAYHGDYSVLARVTWLLHLLSVRVSLSQEQSLRILVRVLGIAVCDTARPPKEHKAAKNKPSAKKTPLDEILSETSSEPLSEPEPPTPEPLTPQPQIHAAETMDETMDTEKLSFLQKLQIFFRKIIHFLQNLEYTFRRIYDTIVNIKSNIQYYYDVLAQDETAAAWETARHQIIRIWRSLRPRKWRVYLHFGSDDPATVGDALGVWGALYPLHEGHVEVEPDFEQNVFEGEFDCRGHVTLYVILWAAFIFFFDKNIKHLKKCLLREEK